jgi:hypothetical protein
VHERLRLPHLPAGDLQLDPDLVRPEQPPPQL